MSDALRAYKQELSRLGSVYGKFLLDTDAKAKQHPGLSADELTVLTNELTSISLNIKEIIPNIIREPAFIQGPVAFTYFTGNVGGIEQKILLLGDVHVRHIRCDHRCNSITLPQFFRNLAKQCPFPLDLFIEARFQETEEKAGGTVLGGEDNYMYDVLNAFEDCLRKNKSRCHEPMRIHYADVRPIIKYCESLEIIGIFLKVVEVFDDPKIILDYSKARWSEPESASQIADVVMDSYRITDRRINLLPEGVRSKFINLLMLPVFNQLTNFYKDPVKYTEFNTIKDLVVEYLTRHERIPDALKLRARALWHEVFKMQVPMMELYTVLRMLKGASERDADRANIGLHPGEFMSRIVGYFGVSHIFNLRDMLAKLGFTVVETSDPQNIETSPDTIIRRYNQCFDYTLIRPAIDDFRA